MKQRFVIGVLVVLALLTVGLSAQVVLAQSGTSTADAMTAATGTAAAGMPAAATGTANANVITLAAGQSVSVPANFWCLDFGKPFPTGITGPKSEAPAKVIAVLDAAQSQGATTSDPYQTQLAIWYAADGTYHDTGNTGHALAQQLVTAAGSGSASTNQGLGTMMSNGGLTVTVNNFQAVPDKAGVPTYHGTGDVTINNTGSQTASFALDGAVFQPTDANAQTLVAQASGTPSTAATATAAVTSVAAATMTAEPATVAAATMTAEPATVAPTATVEATTAVTATSVAAVAPTTTAEATSVAAVASTATAEATPATLPTTGAADANGWMYVLLVLGALIVFAGFGHGFRRAAR